MTKNWPALTAQLKPRKWLKPFKKNPKLHSPAQVQQLRDAIEQWGWTMSILADPKGEIIAGEGRLLASGIEPVIDPVPVIIAKGWTEEQKRAYRIADNRLNELGSWSHEFLASEFGDLSAAAFPMGLTGFDADSLAALFKEGIGEPRKGDSTKLAELFGVPPFTVLNAREGWWQERKRAWLALGIVSELGRGDTAGTKLTMSDTVHKLKPSADQARKRSANATPGGSAMPAANYGKNKARGDGRGRAINGKG